MMSSNNRQVIDSASKSYAGPGIVWTADYHDGEGVRTGGAGGADADADASWKYVLLVNMAEEPMTVSVDFVQLGLTPGTGCNVTDLWAGGGMDVEPTTLSAGSAFAYAELKAVGLRLVIGGISGGREEKRNAHRSTYPRPPARPRKSSAHLHRSIPIAFASGVCFGGAF